MANSLERYPDQFTEARFDYPVLSCMYMRSTNTIVDLEINGVMAKPNLRDIGAWREANKIIQKVMR